MSNSLREGREHFLRRSWREAYESLSLADERRSLEADDLELLATSAYLVGREADFLKFLQRAHHAHVRSGETARAARCAFWLGLMLLLSGEMGQASGWLARARRLVDGHDCVEHGYLMLPVAEEQLAAGDGETAYATAVDATEVGLRFDDTDLVACARHLQGRALIRQGEIGSGLSLLDEAMLAAIGGELSPIMTGLIYCSLVEACQEVFALDRAREWTAALAQWCEDQPQIVAFSGVCLLHRAQIKQLGGDWAAANAEVLRACERFALRGDANPPARALYQQAELHRLRGEFEDAEEGYRNAGRLGLEPQPGLALLRMAQGRTDAACAGIRRALSTVTDPLKRAKFLPACIEILLSAGDIEEARSACRELTEVAGRFDTEALQALAAHARGSVDLTAGDAKSALGSLRRAFELWKGVEAPFESARTRLLLGLACRAVGDDEAAELELGAAGTTFERLGAQSDLHRTRMLSGRRKPAEGHPLTRRELEVLRLVAAGMTNKAIATELHVSGRTVDRHVSNILTKLNVASRAAATAYAFRHRLL